MWSFHDLLHIQNSRIGAGKSFESNKAFSTTDIIVSFRKVSQYSDFKGDLLHDFIQVYNHKVRTDKKISNKIWTVTENL